LGLHSGGCLARVVEKLRSAFILQGRVAGLAAKSPIPVWHLSWTWTNRSALLISAEFQSWITWRKLTIITLIHLMEVRGRNVYRSEGSSRSLGCPNRVSPGKLPLEESYRAGQFAPGSHSIDAVVQLCPRSSGNGGVGSDRSMNENWGIRMSVDYLVVSTNGLSASRHLL